jgi:hypothetical protein
MPLRNAAARTLLICSVMLAGAAAASSQYPCLQDVSPPGFNDRVYYPGTDPRGYPIHTPNWQPRTEPDPAVYNVGSSNFRNLPVWMPVNGECAFSFEVRDNRNDSSKVLTDAAGRRLGVSLEPSAGVELLIFDAIGYSNFSYNREWIAYWTSGRTMGGSYRPRLRAGMYFFVLNNTYSIAGKTVELTFGPLEAAAPISAPKNSATRSTETQPDTDTPPPKLHRTKPRRP